MLQAHSEPTHHKSHTRFYQLLFAVTILALSAIAFYPTTVSAKGPNTDRNDTQRGTSYANTEGRQACKVSEDGKSTCIPFLEVGEPYNAATEAACSQYDCDDEDAYDMGCAVDYGIVATTTIYYDNNALGTTQLWWSNTCQTNWARTVRTVSDNSFYLYAAVERSSPAAWYGWTVNPYTYSSVYTNMVYAPNANTARAYGQLWKPNTDVTASAYTIWR